MIPGLSTYGPLLDQLVEYRPCGHVLYTELSSPPLVCTCDNGILKEVYET